MPNPLYLIRIGTKDPRFEPSLELMNNSFPTDERRHDDELRGLVESSPIFAFNVIMADGERAGLITTWNFGKFIYVEHFAIEPRLRGHGLGIRALRTLQETSALPLVLEVEPQHTSPDAARRIKFYQRAGLNLWATTYTQPSYGLGKAPLPMALMTYQLEETPECTQIVKAILYKNVYKVKTIDIPHALF